MTLTLALLSPVIGLLGGLIGAWLTRNRELDKARRDRITAAYAKLLDAASLGNGPRGIRLRQKMESGEAPDADEEKFQDELSAKFANAHANIAIYGSPEVIGALSAFYDSVPTGKADAIRDAYVALIRAMRRESDADNYEAFDAHVDNILVTGPDRRAAAAMGRAHPKPTVSYGLSFSSPGKAPEA
jgi:hypothetical protein